MTEQIKQLAEQARLITVGDTTRYASDDEFEQRFAELIVAECMEVAVYKDSGYMHPADVAGYMAAGRSTAAQMIREHFGVDE